MKNKYLIIGGVPLYHYCNRGTTAFTGLRIAAQTSSLEEAKQLYESHYDKCGGLLSVIDAESGALVTEFS